MLKALRKNKLPHSTKVKFKLSAKLLNDNDLLFMYKVLKKEIDSRCLKI